MTTAECDSTITGRDVHSQQNCEKQIPNLSYWNPYGLSVIYVFIGKERDWKIKECKIFHSPSFQLYKNINHILTSTDKHTECKFIYEKIVSLIMEKFQDKQYSKLIFYRPLNMILVSLPV